MVCGVDSGGGFEGRSPGAEVREEREVELKLALPSPQLPRLQRHPRIRSLTQGRATTRRVRSLYFDTAGLDLARRGFALRVRRVGSQWVQTLKSREAGTAGLFDRGELEALVRDERPDLASIPDPALRASLTGDLGDQPLAPIVETEVRRTRRRLHKDGSELWFDLDVGEVRSRGGSLPICEIELELVQGRAAALYELALELQETVDLRPAVLDKAELGLATLTGERPAPRKARKISLDADATLEQLLRAVVGGALEQILANERPAYEGTDSEGVHQMRVAIRRLRSTLSLFAPMLPTAPLVPLKEELRWLAGELGAVRDLDVFLEETLEPLFRRFSDDAALKRLHDEAREMRSEAYGRLRHALDSPRYPRLVLQLGRWLCAQGWRDQALSAEAARLFSRAGDETPALLDRRDRKVRKLGRQHAELSADEKHRLRVRVKKLRYAVECLGSVASGGQARRYPKRLATLQDVLGHLNDGAAAEQLLSALLERLGEEATSHHQRAAGFVTGWTARFGEERAAQLAECWKAFDKTPPFWMGH